MVYLLIIAFAFVGVFGHDFQPQASEKVWRRLFIVFTAAIILCVSLRKHLGTDFVVYEARISSDINLPHLFSSTAIFMRNRLDLIFYALSWLGPTLRVIAAQFLFCSLLTIPFSYFLLHNTRYWFSCYLLFFITIFTSLEFEVIFQGAAVGIFLLAWNDLRDKHYIPYMLKILAAAFFHFSALIMLILPVLLRPRIKNCIISPNIFPILAIAILALSMLVPAATPLFEYVSETLPGDSYLGFFFRRAAFVASNLLFSSLSALNWKGLTGFITVYIIIPVIIFYLFRRYFKDSYMVPIVAIYAILSTGGLILEFFWRASFYLLPAFLTAVMKLCPVKANSTFRIHLNGSDIMSGLTSRRTIWLLVLLPLIYFNIKKYTTPMRQAPELPCYAAYIPYLNWIENQDTTERDSIAGTYYDFRGLQNPNIGKFYLNQLNEKPE